jgi:hypothetical protein
VPPSPSPQTGASSGGERPRKNVATLYHLRQRRKQRQVRPERRGERPRGNGVVVVVVEVMKLTVWW